MTKCGAGKACWDCHKEIPHGKVGLSSTPNALVPYPKSAVPQWLEKLIKK
jgi:cytochrome c nitrite reductase small subunit